MPLPASTMETSPLRECLSRGTSSFSMYLYTHHQCLFCPHNYPTMSLMSYPCTRNIPINLSSSVFSEESLNDSEWFQISKLIKSKHQNDNCLNYKMEKSFINWIAKWNRSWWWKTQVFLLNFSCRRNWHKISLFINCFNEFNFSWGLQVQQGMDSNLPCSP